MSIEPLDSASYNHFLATGQGIVFFHKKNCPHCKVMRTVLEKVQAANPGIVVASVDSEERPDVMAQAGVERVPTLCIVREGKIVARNTGVINPRETLALYNNA